MIRIQVRWLTLLEISSFFSELSRTLNHGISILALYSIYALEPSVRGNRGKGKVDLPAVVFPSGKPFDASTWDPVAGSSFDELRNPIEVFIKAQWKPETVDSAHIGLQLVGQRWQENLFAMLKQIEDAVAQLEKS
ncbi:unnamed protein product [Rhizoctonia solani]|uniref:Uncharacterized protein n=1 Tax=Rhizoctonia solani TaxID=456999 RepID=A0A8H2WNN2_9AGAM|nr:unnamed protein product [Rhizoctonia solani]